MDKITWEEKSRVLFLVETANKILEPYNLSFRYAQYDCHGEKPLEPSLVIRDNRKYGEYLDSGIHISEQVKENKIMFYISEINFENKSISASTAALEKITRAQKDCEALNALGLYVSEKLTSLH